MRELVQATLDLVRGLGLANTITDDAARRRRILDRWADVLDRELTATTRRPDDRRARRRCSPTSRPRATGSSTLVGRPRRRRLAYADARAGLERRHPGRAPALDRRGRGARAATDKDGVGRGRARRDRRPDGLRRRSRRSQVARRPARDPRALAHGARPRSAQALRALPGGEKMPWFGPPMSADVDGDRAVHGDLGARASTSHEAPRRRRRRRPTGSGTSPTSASAPATSPSRARARAAGRGVPRRPGRAVAASSGRGDRRTPTQTRHRAGLRLLPAGHPAGPPRRHRPGRRRRRRRPVARHRPGLRGPPGEDGAEVPARDDASA